MIEVHSSAFSEGQLLPIRFAGTRVGGSDMSPPLSWSAVPAGTRSIAVTCVDHHPVAREFLHWVVVDLPSDLPFLAEGASGSAMLPAQARELIGSSGHPGYYGAAPPGGSGSHPYEFTVYALDVDRLDLADSARLPGFLAVIEGHVLDSGSITGTFTR
jgi:Raf kinase inhibitor-like YbhB/YbcL family protein